jgi:hypothetical protein
MSESFESLRGVMKNHIESTSAGRERDACGSMHAFEEAADRAKDELEKFGVVLEGAPLHRPSDSCECCDLRKGPVYVFTAPDDKLAAVATWAFHLALCERGSDASWSRLGEVRDLKVRSRKGVESRSKRAETQNLQIVEAYKASGDMPKAAFVESMTSGNRLSRSTVYEAIKQFEAEVRDRLDACPRMPRPDRVSRVAKECGVSDVIVERAFGD